MTIIEFMQLILNCIFQILLFSLIPFIWWKITKVEEKFLKWVGLKKPKLKGSILLLFTCVIMSFSFAVIDSYIGNISNLAESQNITVNSFKGLGFYAVIPAFMQNFFQNGVSEELLFRGFFSKRFISKLGFKTGNLLQASIFGILHVIPMALRGVADNAYPLILLFISIAGSAFLFTYFNEKVFNGSIIPSILLHGIGNFIFTMIIAFS